ncbi:MAG: phage portal protein [Patescibacteria group bacterium]|nr:phage portal protein [Patescibacteria group bacterium]
MPNFTLWRRQQLSSEVLERGVLVALRPDQLLAQPMPLRRQIENVAKAVTSGAQLPYPGRHPRGGVGRVPRPISATEVSLRAARSMGNAYNVTPVEVEAAMRRQGLEWVEPFAPGRPLAPYYGYNRRPRDRDYRIGVNIGTETRPDRIPFSTLKKTIESYDIASICIRHIINDVRGMPLKWTPLDGETGNVTKEIAQARKFWAKPDGKRHFNTWLARYMMDVLRYDAGAIFKERNVAGKLLHLKVVDGTMFLPQTDYFGDIPEPPAPAFLQFVQGVPWDWLTTDELYYEPMWPLPESLQGVAPIETVLMNANTDMRLQLFFLQFFTGGAVSEILLEAPEDMSDPDSLAEYQETWDDWMEGNQVKRHGARWIPHGSKPFQYKNIEQINPKIAEYVMRRTVAAYGLVPQDLGILDDVNRATSDTQVDTQFRLSTLPNTEHYESLINEITQEELQLPVQAHFDTSREVEDRLAEAQAHQIYVSIGAESPDEVRSDVLGKKIDSNSRVPRLFDSDKLGPIPIGFLIHASGKIDPETYAPYDVDVVTKPFIPAFGERENFTPGSEADGSGGTRPLAIDEHVDHGTGDRPVSVGSNTVPSHRKGAAEDEEGSQLPRVLISTKKEDLSKWRTKTLKRLKDGKKPIPFHNSAIDATTHDLVWAKLEKAETLEEVNAAFAKGRDPFMAGLAVRAGDTGRVLMIQRTKTDANDHAGGTWEFPGGHIEQGESPADAAVREWEEEVGLRLPSNVQRVGDWRSSNDCYQGFIVEIPCEEDLDLKDRSEISNPDGDAFESCAWWEPHTLSTNSALRPELKNDSQLVLHALNGSTTAKGNKPPKGESPDGKSGRPGPWGHLEQEIVDHYLPLIQEALKGLLNTLTTAAHWLAHHHPERGAELTAQEFANTIKLNSGALEAALHDLWTDAFLAGGQDAAHQVADATGDLAAAVGAIDWGRWKPGHPRASNLVAGTGFFDLLNNAHTYITGIEQTILNDIAAVLQQGLAEGWSVDKIAGGIDALISNPNKAWTIAVTETNRAMSAASYQLYKDNGFDWDLILMPGACEGCKAIARKNPHPTTDKRIPPEHPLCRCAMAPHIKV